MKLYTKRLAASIPAFWIHDVTKQEVEEHHLDPGTLVQEVVENYSQCGYVVTDFVASFDNGINWRQYRAYDRIQIIETLM